MEHPATYDRPAPRCRIAVGVGLLVFLVAALLFVWQEHRIHILGVAPSALLLACPAVHFVIHRDHHSARTDQPSGSKTEGFMTNGVPDAGSARA